MCPKHFLPSMAIAAILFAPSLHAGSYTYTDLGTLGGANSAGVAINNSGQVVGWSDTLDTTPKNPVTQAFSYSSGFMSPLGAVSGSSNSYATGINSGGQIVGGADNQAFIANPGGTKQTLPPLVNGTYSYAMAINDSGTVVGNSDTSANGQQVNHAFSFNPAGAVMTDLGTLGGLTSFAYAINTDNGVGGGGKVVGASDTALDSTNVAHAFVADGSGSMTDLGKFIDNNLTSQANNINNNDRVVGQYYDTSNVSHAFAIDATGANKANLLDLSGQAVSAPNNNHNSAFYGINAFDEIVGYSNILDNSTFHAAIVEDGIHMLDLNTLVLNMPNDTYLWSALAINDLGMITGIANIFDPNTQSYDIYHAFLLTPSQDITPPLPEPASLWLLLSGLVGIPLFTRGAVRRGR